MKPAIALLVIATAQAAPEPLYLGFQIFTNHSTDPQAMRALNNGMPDPLIPGTPALRRYVLDVKTRIGGTGNPQTKLAVILGPLSFDQTDAQVGEFIEKSFDLALETGLAVGFHIDDSIFWRRRRDLWSDPQNVEALDWQGSPNTARRLDWGKEPLPAPPQMCFNSPAIRREVQARATLIGHAIRAGLARLQARQQPELFAGVIAGWETMIGRDFDSDRPTGFRALRNRGFSSEHPPLDMDRERDSIVQEFIELWTSNLAAAGVPSQRIYSHIAFHPSRAAAPAVAFGRNHRPGFSTYPQPGLFEAIHAELPKHQQTGWGSCEGTNMEPSSGPGQTGIDMETYLAKVFNHGGTLVNVFAWGIGGEAMKNMSFRVVTESDEAIAAYRKFLSGTPLTEAAPTLSLMQRLPAKIRRIQTELPPWVQQTGNQQAMTMMKQLQQQMNAKNFEEVEKTADAILRLLPQSAAVPEEARVKMRHGIDSQFVVFRDKVQQELQLTPQQIAELETALPEVLRFMQSISALSQAEQDKQLKAYRPKAREILEARLNGTLTNDQRNRLRQIVLQREQLFSGEAWDELQVTPGQRAQFAVLIQQTQTKIQGMLEGARATGGPDAIRPKVLEARAGLEASLEALLTEQQRKQWASMLGKPMPTADIFDFD